MQKFGFRLESVRNLKVQMEDNAKNNLALASRELEKQKEFLTGLKTTRESSISELNSKVDQGISISQIRAYNNYLSFLKQRITEQKENVNVAKNQVDIRRESLVKAVQERKILDKLREKKYGEFLKEQGKAEQLLIDELNSFKFKDGSGEENAGKY
ncbi:flagellar export protein FliJ [Ruminiclostridium papyrosolvens]|uniref:Flagellar FliJ protein n=1 Tax=Ruminiclostridium papyrosolvens C7 TaxID=1330534 RepID=U4R563_9FIRM|nr:flagellar export protein FliJ [Ruminiclostridium papyrosolvens]EPR13077.1 flagellar export protein FliJ [Ruminiclostridium papyrosolvens C7]